MIRINLLGEKPDYGPIYMLQATLFAGMMALGIFICFIIHETIGDQLESLEADKVSYEGQLAKLKDRTARVEELEKNKNLLRTKLTTIAKLKMNKSGPVHLLADLTESIPERAWLMASTQKGETMEIRGLALDPQTVSNFMRKLEETPSFGEVDLSYSKQTLKDGVPIQEFSVLAKLENPLARQQDAAKAATAAQTAGAKGAKAEKAKPKKKEGGEE